jgi:hypothetical protein
VYFFFNSFMGISHLRSVNLFSTLQTEVCLLGTIISFA